MNFPGLSDLCAEFDKEYPPNTVLAEYHNEDGSRITWATNAHGKLFIKSVTPCTFTFWRNRSDVAPDLQHSDNGTVTRYQKETD